MARAVYQMAREGWRIHSVRKDTQMVVASYYGSAVVFRWDGDELVKVTP